MEQRSARNGPGAKPLAGRGTSGGWRLAAVLLGWATAASCGLVGVCDPEQDPALAGAGPRPGRSTGEGGARAEPGGGGAEGVDVWGVAAGDVAAPGTGSGGPPGGLVPGVASYEKMNVFERPDYASPRIGYTRRGTKVLVRGPVDAPDCGENGQKWFQLEEGGYVCAGRGLLIGAPLSSYLYTPPPPDFEAPVPYRYASVRRYRTPVYRKIPTREEIQQVQDFLFPPPEEGDAGTDGAVGPYDPDAGPGPEPTEEPPGGDETPAGPVDDLGDLGVEPMDEPPPPPTVEVDAGAAPPVSADADAGAAEAEDDGGLSDADRDLLQRGPRHALLTRVLMRGFTVALGPAERVEGKLWYRTLEGGYVAAEDVAAIDIRPLSIGVPLSGTLTLPVGFVIGRGARVYTRNDRDEIIGSGNLDRFAAFGIVEEVTRGDRRFYRTHDDRYVSPGRNLAIAQAVDPPRAVGQFDKWIVVDLTTQTLAAYEGRVPVYATLVSTGKEGFETPTGVFRILGKHISTPMDDFTLGEAYAIDEVPYVMYFQQNVALHGAFWHRNFGNTRSHGCVNLAPNDAHWLFDWAHPFLSEGWHGVYSTDTDAGTIVWVRKSRPRRDDS